MRRESELHGLYCRSSDHGGWCCWSISRCSQHRWAERPVRATADVPGNSAERVRYRCMFGTTTGRYSYTTCDLALVFLDVGLFIYLLILTDCSSIAQQPTHRWRGNHPGIILPQASGPSKKTSRLDSRAPPILRLHWNHFDYRLGVLFNTRHAIWQQF